MKRFFIIRFHFNNQFLLYSIKYHIIQQKNYFPCHILCPDSGVFEKKFFLSLVMIYFFRKLPCTNQNFVYETWWNGYVCFLEIFECLMVFKFCERKISNKLSFWKWELYIKDVHGSLLKKALHIKHLTKWAPKTPVSSNPLSSCNKENF